MKKRIFIYGDSNVWGDSATGARIPYTKRWVNQLAVILRGRATITSDGVCGRIAGNYRTDSPHRNGRSSFSQALRKAGRVDLLLIALGTNDTQERFARTVDDIITDLLWYRRASHGVDVLYIIPPSFTVGKTSNAKFTKEALRKQQEVVRRASELGVCIMLPNIPLSDGLHFSVKGHNKVSRIVKTAIEPYLCDGVSVRRLRRQRHRSTLSTL